MSDTEGVSSIRHTLGSMIGCSYIWGKTEPSEDILNPALEIAPMSSQETHSTRLETSGVICSTQEVPWKLSIYMLCALMETQSVSHSLMPR